MGCINGRMTESTDLTHAKWRLIGSKKGRKEEKARLYKSNHANTEINSVGKW